MYEKLTLILAYLIVSSVFLGWFVYESEKNVISTLDNVNYQGDIIRLDGSIPLEMFIDTKYSTTQLSFVNLTGYAGNVLQISPAYTAIGTFNPYRNTLYIRGIQPDNNVYTVTYHIVNPDNADFAIIPASYEDVSNARVLKANFKDMDTNPRLIVTYDYDDLIYDAITQPIATNANIAPYWQTSGENKITTILNRNLNVISIYLNDNPICISAPVNIGEKSDTMHGGLRLLEESNIYLTSIDAPVYLTEDTQNTDNILIIIAQVLAWNVDEKYIPNMLNLLLIKVPMLFLIVGLAFYLRGVS